MITRLQPIIDTSRATPLAVQPLTAAAFAPFGLLLERPRVASEIHHPQLDYWHSLAEARFSAQPVWGWLETRQQPFLLSKMERHNHSDEVFICASGRSVMPFALGGKLEDPAAQPDPATLKFFIVETAQAFLVPKGLWHAPAFPLTAAAQFLILLEALLPSTDIDTRQVGPFNFHPEQS